MNRQKLILKCCLIGNPSVGKTSLMERAVLNKFTRRMSSTIGIDYRVLGIRGVQPVDIQVWDTAGSERFRAITRTYYRNIDCAIVAYSSQDPQSLLDVAQWVREIRQIDEDTPILLVATKYDNPTVGDAEAYEIATNLGMHGPVFTSSKNMKSDEIRTKLTPFFRAIARNKQVTAVPPAIENIEFCAGPRKKARAMSTACCTIV